jgi:hypothetical protein
MTKTVLDKLGFKSGMTGWARNVPSDVASIIPFKTQAPAKKPDIIVAFLKTAGEVPATLEVVVTHYERGKSLWFAYPKKTGSIKTDLSRDHGWEPLVGMDLLPVTQVAIDATWSALRFRYRDEIASLKRRSDLPGKK